MIKLLAVDMDKTSLNDKNQMSDETLKTLYDIANQGIIIVPTTGRALNCLPHQLENQSFYTYVISSNGAKVINIKKNKTISRSEIQKEDALSFLSACHKFKVGKIAHIHNQYYVQGKLFNKFGYFIYGEDAKKTLNSNNLLETIDSLPFDVEEIQLYFFNNKTRKSIKDILAQYKNLSAAYTNHYVEIYSKNTSKGIALKELAKTLGIKKEEIACIGDGENDLSMFEESGFKMAVGNAVDSLKEKADIILPSNNDNGICKIIEYLEYEKHDK